MKIQFDTPPSSARETNGLAVRYAAAKRQVPRWRWYLLLAMVLVLPAYLLIRFSIAYWWETTPAQVTVEQITLRAPAAGRVARIAEAGATVQPGQPLMELEAPAGETPTPPIPVPAATTAESQPGQAARQAMLAEAQRLAQSRLAIQQERLQAMQKLREQGAATRQEVDNLRFQELQAQADLSRARADVREHQALLERERRQALAPLPTPPDMAQTPPTPAATAVAPFAATVVRPLVRNGEWITPGTEIAVLQGQEEPLVLAYLPAEMARYAQVGRQATLRFMDGGRARARVVSLVTEAQSPPADRVSPLTPRTPSIVVRLQALEPLPAAYRIHQLPLDVRFDWVAGSLF